jgi:hypothetical protein
LPGRGSLEFDIDIEPADSDNDPLYLAAFAVEQDTTLGEEMAACKAGTIAMG